MERKKVIYIAGPIAGVTNYWEAFEQAEEDLRGLGYIPLSPAHLPQGMTNEQYTRIDFAMIDSADAVLFLPGHEYSVGATLEASYCRYTGKPGVLLRVYDLYNTGKDPRKVVQERLKHDLEEVFKQ